MPQKNPPGVYRGTTRNQMCLICDKTFRGSIKTVDMLMKLHQKYVHNIHKQVTVYGSTAKTRAETSSNNPKLVNLDHTMENYKKENYQKIKDQNILYTV